MTVPERKLREYCGVFGIFGHPEAARLTYYGLLALQHRGQEGAGMAVTDGERLRLHKGMGHVTQVFRTDDLDRLPGGAAIGQTLHVRRGGAALTDELQPLFVDHRAGELAYCYNGALTNAEELRRRFEESGSIFHTRVDIEVVAHLLARWHREPLAAALERSLAAIEGGYAALWLTNRQMAAARDPKGIRPLCLGKLEWTPVGDPLLRGAVRTAWVVASETCALDTVGAEFVRDVEPGELLVIDEDGLRSAFPETVTANREVVPLRDGREGMDRQDGPGREDGPVREDGAGREDGQRPGKGDGFDRPMSVSDRRDAELRPRLCSFEFVYFARPDSVLNGRNVHIVRKNLGRELARESPVAADVVVGVPDSSLAAASGYAEEAGLPYEVGLIKNRYIGRTFIKPTRTAREQGVLFNLNAVRQVVEGKRVVLVDDSIVRGTTSRRLTELLRAAGAMEVHMRISSPSFRHACPYGLDTADESQLVATGRNDEEIGRHIGADSLHYLSPEGMLRAFGASGTLADQFAGTFDREGRLWEGPAQGDAVSEGGRVGGADRGQYCMACFTGRYPVPLAGPGRSAEEAEGLEAGRAGGTGAGAGAGATERKAW